MFRSHARLSDKAWNVQRAAGLKLHAAAGLRPLQWRMPLGLTSSRHVRACALAGLAAPFFEPRPVVTSLGSSSTHWQAWLHHSLSRAQWAITCVRQVFCPRPNQDSVIPSTSVYSCGRGCVRDSPATLAVPLFTPHPQAWVCHWSRFTATLAVPFDVKRAVVNLGCGIP